MDTFSVDRQISESSGGPPRTAVGGIVRAGPPRTGALIYNESGSQGVFFQSLLPSLRYIIPFEPTASKLVCWLCWLCRTVRRIKYSSASTEPRTQTTKRTGVPCWNIPANDSLPLPYMVMLRDFYGKVKGFHFFIFHKNPVTWPCKVRGAIVHEGLMGILHRLKINRRNVAATAESHRLSWILNPIESTTVNLMCIE